MKPAERKSVSSHVVDPGRRAVESILRKAVRAAAPDYYVQQATGRVLTRLVAVVAGLQVGGVLLWLGLVFSGIVDASKNLDGFMISQLVVFVTSIAVGIVWTVRHLNGLRADAKALEPGLATPILELLESDIEPEKADELDERFDILLESEESSGRLSTTTVYSGQLEQGAFRIRDVRKTDESDEDTGASVCGLVLTSEAGPDLEARIVVEAGARKSEASTGLRQIDIDTGDDAVSVYSDDVDEARRLVETDEFREGLSDFFASAESRDRLTGDEVSAGEFTAVFEGGSTAVFRRSSLPLFPPAEEADEATVDELMESIREVQTAIRWVEVATRKEK